MFHILVVDDDKNTRLYFGALLKNAGYTVSTASNGEEALVKIGRAKRLSLYVEV
jgi:CheY-like chemotaxis protein